MAVRKFKSPLVVKKGVSTSFTIKFTNPDGTAKDITDFVFRTDLRYNLTDVSAIGTLTNGDGFTVDGPNGILTMTFAKTKIASVDTTDSKVDFPFRNVFIDIEYYDPSESPINWLPLAMGIVQVYEQGTRTNDV